MTNLGGWENVYLKNGNTHCLPSNDLQPHAANINCWCKPVYIGDGVYSHNSKDGRENFEELAAGKLS